MVIQLKLGKKTSRRVSKTEEKQLKAKAAGQKARFDAKSKDKKKKKNVFGKDRKPLRDIVAPKGTKRKEAVDLLSGKTFKDAGIQGDSVPFSPAGAIGVASKAPGIISKVKSFFKKKPKPSTVNTASQVGKPGTFLAGERIVVNAKTHPNLSIKQRAALSKELGNKRIRQLADAEIAARFPTNTKSIGQTANMLAKRGATAATIALMAGTIGTYPFASFIKEEAIQTLQFPIQKAIDQGDIEGAESLIAEVREMTETDLSWIPYVNVLESLNSYFDAANKSVEQFERNIEIIRGESEGEEESQDAKFDRLAEERDERDKEFEERRDADRKEDKKRDKKFEEIRQASIKRQDERDAEFDKRRKEDAEKDRQDTLFFEAIRKRNEGLRLTPEEKKLLESRGASSQTSSGGRSNLDFGLF